jgi:hypothetical protein
MTDLKSCENCEAFTANREFVFDGDIVFCSERCMSEAEEAVDSPASTSEGVWDALREWN